MQNKHKFFAIGLLLGFIIPFAEHYISVQEIDNPFEKFVLMGTAVWHYIFLYVVVINSILLYVKQFREKINPQSKLVFIVSGVSSGFAIISLIAATVTYFQGIS